MPKRLQKLSLFEKQRPVKGSCRKPIRPSIQRFAMNTSPHTILLPLLIALGSTGIAGTAIAEDNPHNLITLPLPLQTTADAEQPETPRFRVLTTVDFTDPDLFGFPWAAPQELTAPQESTTTEADQPSDRTIIADGSERSLNLSGRRGRNADHPEVQNYAGEPGGDGENLTIYYTDLTHLQSIYVNAAGGKGGAGRPGSTQQVCSPRPSTTNNNGDTSSSFPHNLPLPNPPTEPLVPPAPRPQPPPQPPVIIRPPDLPPGMPEIPQETIDQINRDAQAEWEQRARDYAEAYPDPVEPSRPSPPSPPRCNTTTIPPGPAGQDGQPGKIRLIKAPEPLPPEQPAVTVSLSDLSDRTFDLSKHLWETNSGAAALLAPGSTIADEYLEFIARLEETVRVQWQGATYPSQSEVDQVIVSLNQQGDVELDFGSEVWVDHTSQRQESGLEIAIAALVPVEEVTDLALGRVVADDNTLNLQVIDRAGHADTLATTFHIHYRSAPAGALHEPRPRWQTRYQGEIPAELVTRDHNRFVIDLSQLPIEAQYQRSGTPVNIEITATRSLGDRAKTQTLRWQDQLR